MTMQCPTFPVTTVSSGLSRRRLLKELGSAAGALLVGSLGCARPDRTAVCFQARGRQVRFLVPFPPGGGYDIYSRLLEPHYEKQLGAEIAIENTPGAGGMISAITLKSARPDGFTLGILNAPGLLVASMTGEARAPDPVRDFTILGRIARTRSVLVTAVSSPLRTLDDLLAEATKRTILFGTSEVSSNNFVNMVGLVSLLGIPYEFISGFPGSREVLMGIVRGEVDITSISFESALDHIDAQDLRPILQLSRERLDPHSSLDGVPLLCGKDGVAVRRARELNRDPAQAESDASALTRVTGAGLVVAGPSRMDEKLFRCLEGGLYETLINPAFRADVAGARRSLDAARGEPARDELWAAAGDAPRFVPLVRAAMLRMRRG